MVETISRLTETEWTDKFWTPFQDTHKSFQPLDELLHDLYNCTAYGIACVGVPVSNDLFLVSDLRARINPVSLARIEQITAAETCGDIDGNHTFRKVYDNDMLDESAEHVVLADNDCYNATVDVGSSTTPAHVLVWSMPGHKSGPGRSTERVCRKLADAAAHVSLYYAFDHLQVQLAKASALNNKIMNIAHGMSNSLQAVIGFSQLALLDQNLSNAQRHNIELALTGAQQIVSQVIEINRLGHSTNGTQTSG